MYFKNRCDKFSSAEEYRKYFKGHKKVKDYKGYSGKIHSIGWNLDGKYLAAGSYDHTVTLFAFAQNSLSKTASFKEHENSVDQLCWSKTHSDLLATASADKTVRVWDARHDKCVKTVLTKGENLNINWSPDGNYIAVGNKDDLITFIDTRTFTKKDEIPFNFEVNEIGWNKEGDMFFATAGGGKVTVLSFPEMKQISVLKGHCGPCNCIEFDPNGKYFAVGSADSNVSLWTVDELACVRVFPRLQYSIRSISFSANGELIASSSEDPFIDISEVETGFHVLDIPVDAICYSIDWHPKRRLLAYTHEDKDAYDRKKDSGCVKIYGFSA